MIKKGVKSIDGYNYVMVYFTGFNEENLSVLPTHRLVKGVAKLDSKIKNIEEYFTFSPHTAAFTEESIQNRSKEAFEQVNEFVKGKAPHGKIDLKRGY